MQLSAKKAKGENRGKRREGERVFKRKKRSTYVNYSLAELADIFSARPGAPEPRPLLQSPATFLRQVARTFQSEFPGYMPPAALVAAIVGAAPESAAAAAAGAASERVSEVAA